MSKQADKTNKPAQPKAAKPQAAHIQPTPVDSHLLQLAREDPARLTPSQRTHLQRTLGNQALSRLVSNPSSVIGNRSAENGKQSPISNLQSPFPIQPKLTVNAVGDKYEQEADAVAKEVVQKLNAPQLDAATATHAQRQTEEEEPIAQRIQRQAAPEKEEIQLQRQEMPVEEALQLQRQETEEKESQDILSFEHTIANPSQGSLSNYVIMREPNFDSRQRSRETKPKNCPRGTKSIDQSGLSHDQIEDVKKKNGLRGKDWVGISPEGHVIANDEDGFAEDLGHWTDSTDAKYEIPDWLWEKLSDVALPIGALLIIAMFVGGVIGVWGLVSALGYSVALVIIGLLDDSIENHESEGVVQTYREKLHPNIFAPHAVAGLQTVPPALQRQTLEEDELQLQRQETENEELQLQRQKLEEEALQKMAMLQREAAPEEEELQLQRQEMPEDEEMQLQRQELEEEDPEQLAMTQRQPQDFTQGGTVDSHIEAQINQSRGGGQPMEDSIRQPMEQAFGADFSDVRIHTDAQAHNLNEAIQARAFTTNNEIFFNGETYKTDTTAGKELIAHELTHVIQQTKKQNGDLAKRESNLSLERSEEREVKPSEIPNQDVQYEFFTRLAYDSKIDPESNKKLHEWGYLTGWQKLAFDTKTGFFAGLIMPLSSSKHPVISFEGSSELRDWISDAHPEAIGWDQFQQNKEKIASLIEYAGMKVDLTGHSLGGALAQHTAVAFPGNVNRVVTFQSPGISQEAVENYKKTKSRLKVTHHFAKGDIVDLGGESHLPGTFYEHDTSKYASHDEAFWEAHTRTLFNRPDFGEKLGELGLIDIYQAKGPVFQTSPIRVHEQHPNWIKMALMSQYRNKLAQILWPNASLLESTIHSMVHDDDFVRDWVSDHRGKKLKDQSLKTKVKMIKTLMGGWISDEDISTIEIICQSVSNNTEATVIKNTIEFRLQEMISIGQRTKMRVILSKM